MSESAFGASGKLARVSCPRLHHHPVAMSRAHRKTRFGRLALLVLFAGGCRDRAPAPPLSGSANAPLVLPPLAARAEVVAEADVLAVEGSRVGGGAGAELTRRAAALRYRLWRMERREADALEALELYRSAGKASWDG